MVTLAEIYNWFMTGKKPTQAQFWASWGAFWHKLEKIPVSAIEGLTYILNAKAEKEQFDGHLNNTTVHGSYAIIFGNKFQLIKHPLNNDLTKVNTPQNNDFILNGFRNNTTLWKEARLIDEDNLNLDESWIVYNSTDTTPE